MPNASSVRATAEGMPAIPLAELCRTYNTQWAAISARSEEDIPDEELDELCDATFRTTLAEIIETPIVTADDAITALDWVMTECDGFVANFSVPAADGPYDRAISHLLGSLRAWIAEKGGVL